MNIKRIKYGVMEIEKEFGRLTFAKAILSFRLCEEMTQIKMAKKLKISKQSLCDLEKGRRIPSPSRAAKIAKNLGMHPETFIQLAITDQFNEEKLNYDVKVTSRSKKASGL